MCEFFKYESNKIELGKIQLDFILNRIDHRNMVRHDSAISKTLIRISLIIVINKIGLIRSQHLNQNKNILINRP